MIEYDRIVNKNCEMISFSEKYNSVVEFESNFNSQQ